jgi:glutamine synthetase adenylyltransferase
LGEPAHYAKGADALPIAVTGELEDALVRSLELKELRRALRVAATRLLLELGTTDAAQAWRLERPIHVLADLAEGILGTALADVTWATLSDPGRPVRVDPF